MSTRKGKNGLWGVPFPLIVTYLHCIEVIVLVSTSPSKQDKCRLRVVVQTIWVSFGWREAQLQLEVNAVLGRRLPLEPAAKTAPSVLPFAGGVSYVGLQRGVGTDHVSRRGTRVNQAVMPVLKLRNNLVQNGGDSV